MQLLSDPGYYYVCLIIKKYTELLIGMSLVVILKL